MPRSGYKTCSKCGVEKSLEEFYRRTKRSPDGRMAHCKVCDNAQKKKWIAANRGRHNEFTRAWKAKNPAAVALMQQRSEERFPEKFKARRAVNGAVYRGKLEKPAHCERCGAKPDSLYLHGHHKDYSKPLEIEWLCSRCHTDEHEEAPCR